MCVILSGDCLLTEGKVACRDWNNGSSCFIPVPSIGVEVCRNISRQLPADFVLTTFKPSIDELDEVLTAFRERGRQSDIEKLLYVIAEDHSDPC